MPVHVAWSDCITSYDKKKLPEMLAYYESKGCSITELSDVMQAYAEMEILNMKKLYEKSELTFALGCGSRFTASAIVANPLNEIIGTAYAASAAFRVLQTIVLFVIYPEQTSQKRYGLCRSLFPPAASLYYVPLAILASGNPLERRCAHLFARRNVLPGRL
ncbi:MAG: hypothetical protein ACLU3I_21190 [Acutalibacteraceae bacterium]